MPGDFDRDLAADYAELERLRSVSDGDWCPLLNPHPQMDRWQAAIRRARAAEARAEALEADVARLRGLVDSLAARVAAQAELLARAAEATP